VEKKTAFLKKHKSIKVCLMAGDFSRENSIFAGGMVQEHRRACDLP